MLNQEIATLLLRYGAKIDVINNKHCLLQLEFEKKEKKGYNYFFGSDLKVDTNQLHCEDRKRINLMGVSLITFYTCLLIALFLH